MATPVLGTIDPMRDHSPGGVTATDITKSYRERQVLRGVSLQAAPGQVVGLLGPNGIGKSTTLRILAGVDQPDSGTITVGGIDPATDPMGARRNVGYLPDVGGLIPRVTVDEHLNISERLWGLKNCGSWRNELVERLGLSAMLNMPAAKLSHGMSRRCGLALALLAKPAVILADEPFDGVDPVAGQVVVDLLREAADDGAAVVCSTHLLHTAKQMCDEVVIMDSGTIVRSCPADELADLDLSQTYREAVTR